MNYQWKHKVAPSKKTISDLAASINVSFPLASILARRGVSTFEEARSFFRPSMEHLHDPFQMKDLDKAVNRITEAVFNHEKILFFGDYDVDGTTSVSLMYNFFTEYTFDIDFYIPDRYQEGYGISEKGIRWASENGFSLIVSLDCGIRAIHMAELCHELNLDLIITDHHLPGVELPDAFAVVDPKRKDCKYPYKELSGCGVAFKILHAYCMQNGIDESVLFQYLDLLAVSIAADIVPVTGENRILSYFGLKKLNESPSPGLKSLISICGYKSTVDVSSIVFGIAPRINAIGRLAHAKTAVELLTADDIETIERHTALLNIKNNERRDLDSSTTDEAIEIIEGSEDLMNAKTTVLFNPDWHKGIIGIVASRCIERYYRPTVILTQSGDKATGSARSIAGFDIHEALGQCSEYLEQYGGHKYAAGLTLEISKIRDFKECFERVAQKTLTEELLTPSIDIEEQVAFDRLTPKFHSIIEQMSPFGPQNMRPILYSENLYLRTRPVILKEKHLKIVAYQHDNTNCFPCIGFGLGHLASELEVAESFKMVFCLEMNEYMGNKSLQLHIKDIKFS